MKKFIDYYRELNPAQKLAVDTTDGPVMVVAGPGTGKTQLLSLRVANILKKTDTNPSNILCLTYTEAGQKAMQERLVEIIGREATGIEVHTYHSFGNGIINRYNHFFPELENFKSGDDLSLHEILEQCFEELDPSDPLSKRFFDEWIYLQNAKTRISQLKRAGISTHRLTKIIHNDLDWSKNLGSAVSNIFSNYSPISKKTAPQIFSELNLALSTEIDSDTYRALKTELEEAQQQYEASGKTSLLTKFKNNWLQKEGNSLLFKSVSQLNRLMSLVNIYENYEKKLSSKKLYDYDDMIYRCLNKMQENSELLSALQEQYQYIVADEYQDTNLAQSKIIEMILDNPVNFNRPNIMIVGDDDQAIYSFQGAQSHIMTYFRERWTDVKVITLTDNYRSTQSILDTARNIIVNNTERLENIYEDIHKNLKANIKSNDNSAPSYINMTDIGSLIQFFRSLGTNNSSTSTAILATKHKYLDKLIKEMQKHSIDYYYEGRDDILADGDIQQLINISKVGCMLQQQKYEQLDYFLPIIFASNILSVSKVDAWHIANEAIESKQTWAETILNNKTAYNKLQQQLKIIEEYCAYDSPLESLSKIATDVINSSDTALNIKIESLISHATSYYGGEDIDLYQIIRYAEKCIDAAIPLKVVVEEGEPDSPIKIMTAYRSKGQEFNHVLLLHADSHTWLHEKGNNNKISLPPGYEIIEKSQATYNERLRLTYVAMTRAKSKLHLINILNSTDDNVEVLPGTEELLTTTFSSDVKNDQVDESEIQQWQSWYLPTNTRESKLLKSILKNRLSKLVLSPTQITGYLTPEYGGPAQYLVHSLLKVPTIQSREAIFGSLIHECLSIIQNLKNQNQKITTKKVESLLIEDMDETDQPNQVYISYAAGVAMEFYNKAVLIKAGGKPELDIKCQIEGINFRGKIDNLYIADEEIDIIDYKTAKPIHTWQTRDNKKMSKLYSYNIQLALYNLMLAKTNLVKPGQKVNSIIAFTQTSEPNVYPTLTKTFKPNEFTEVIDLIKTIYKKIVDCEYIRTDNYPTGYKGTAQLLEKLLV